MRLVADLETDGLLDTVSRVHCLVTQDADTGAVRVYHNDPAITPKHGTIAEGLGVLASADVRAGHNWDGYDEKVLDKLYPGWSARGPVKGARILDTLVGATVVFPDEHQSHLDHGRSKIPGQAMPPKLMGRHSLEAWGWRLGNRKGAKPDDYSRFTQSMLDYCIQDVAVTTELFLRLDARVKNGSLSLRAWDLEQRFKREVRRQEENGVAFDVKGAEWLTARLQRIRAVLAERLQVVFPPETVVTYSPVKKKRKETVVTFNPGSDVQIGRRLRANGWKPTKWTDTGRPKVDLDTLEDIDVPGARELVAWLTVDKRLEQIAEGASAWLKKVGKDGRIHGRVAHNGAVTSRVKHSGPNMSAVPKVGKWLGRLCRRRFVAGPGHALVGLDAKGLELRMLAHYFAPLDGGAYAKIVSEGDPHAVNADAFGIPPGPQAVRRDTAKRGIYCLLYGGGDAKLGKTLGMSREAAKKARALFNKNTRPFPKLQRAIADEVRRTKSLGLPDGRRVWVRSMHSALNTLLQGSGAIVMKASCVRLHDRLRELGIDDAVRQVLFSHDEIQLEVPLAHVDTVVAEARACVTWAGERLKIRCPLAADVHVGKDWSETH
jgi:DNA polymerase I-like protein with 3'-5' exonuclease and polymerase domains